MAPAATWLMWCSSWMSRHVGHIVIMQKALGSTHGASIGSLS
jgi:hypothetical protein